MNQFQKTFLMALVVFLMLLTGCVGNDSDQSNQSSGGNQRSDKKIVYQVKNILSTRALESAKLRAFLTIDNEARQEMSLSQLGDGFEMTFNVQTGNHYFKIEFEYSEDQFGNTNIPLVKAIKEFNIQEGNNDLTYLESDYEHFDSDEDGFTNANEVNSNSNPLDPNSRPDVTLPIATVSPVNLSKIGSTQTIRIDFSESMIPNALAIEGNIAEQSDGGVWSRSSSENDTLVFTPANSWDEGVLQLRIDVNDLAGNPIDTLNLSYSVDITPPESVVSPINESVISASQTIVVTFNESMNSELFELTGSLAEHSDSGYWSSRTINNDTLTINPKTQWPHGQQTLSIRGSDIVNNPITAIDLIYEVNASSATSKATPQSGSTINNIQTLQITFNKSINTSTIQMAGSLAYESDSGAWSSTVVENDTLIISPQIAWSAGAKTIIVQANDMVGNPIAPLELIYTVDATSPTATVAPASTLISDTQIIKLTFSETIDTDTLFLGGSMLSSSDGGTLTSVKTSDDTLTIKPTNNWGSGRQTLTVNASDLVGNAMEQLNIEFNVDNTKPIVTLTPAFHSTINGSQPIVYKFNESMLTSSLQITGSLVSQSKDPVWSTTNETNDTLTFSPVSVWQPGAQGIIISATDLVGNFSGLLLAGYTVDASSPTAVADPQSGTSIIENQAIKIVFGETMDTNALTLNGTLSSASKSGEWSTSKSTNDTLILTPNVVWPTGEQNLEILASDLAGNSSTIVLSYKVLKQYNPINYQLSGLIKYNGSPIIDRTFKTPSMWAWSWDTESPSYLEDVELDYYPTTGHYGINGLPDSGEVDIYTYIHVQEQRQYVRLPGNFENYTDTSFNLSELEPTEAAKYDIEMQEFIHLLTPYDNSEVIYSVGEHPPESSPLTFSWSPIKGAAGYNIRIQKINSTKSIIEQVYSYNVTNGSTSTEIILPTSLEGEYYEFVMHAYNTDGNQVGLYITTYKDSSSNYYGFTVK